MDTLLAQEGRRNVKDIVLIVIDTIKTVMEGNSWSMAFKANGISEDTAIISKHIKDQLEWPVLPAIVAGPPTVEELISAWPISRRVPFTRGLHEPRARCPRSYRLASWWSRRRIIPCPLMKTAMNVPPMQGIYPTRTCRLCL